MPSIQPFPQKAPPKLNLDLVSEKQNQKPITVNLDNLDASKPQDDGGGLENIDTSKTKDEPSGAGVEWIGPGAAKDKLKSVLAYLKRVGSDYHDAWTSNKLKDEALYERWLSFYNGYVDYYNEKMSESGFWTFIQSKQIYEQAEKYEQSGEEYADKLAKAAGSKAVKSEKIPETEADKQQKEISTGLKWGLGIGIVAALGVGTWMILKLSNKSPDF